MERTSFDTSHPGDEADRLGRRPLMGAAAIAAAAMLAAPRADGAQARNGPVATGHAGPGSLPPEAIALDAALFPGFRQSFIATTGVAVEGAMASDATINTYVAGHGPPLLLIHGHPEHHVCWHRVAEPLSARFTVVLVDLRGYGYSSKPDGGPDHVDYAKRAMGADLVQVMAALGFSRFQAVGHDRGGRVLQFMMLDSPHAVERGVVLDIAPTDLMYAQTNSDFARRYFWWFFQIQDAPLPERFIGSMPAYYVSNHLEIQSKTPGAVTPAALAAYIDTYSEPAAIHAVCEDYRAAFGVDSRILQRNRAEGRKLTPPLMAVWGDKGTVGKLFDVVGLWRQEAETVSGQGLPCGHLLPEEDPDGLLRVLAAFLRAT